MPTCIFPPGVCIGSPTCTTKCQLDVLDAKKPLTVDRAKIKSTLESHDITPKE